MREVSRRPFLYPIDYPRKVRVADGHDNIFRRVNTRGVLLPYVIPKHCTTHRIPGESAVCCAFVKSVHEISHVISRLISGLSLHLKQKPRFVIEEDTIPYLRMEIFLFND
ncbi:hypothetical protein CDAR_114011 [Caerostris darwini]|uniref:Uncharacterized protein n=1 Tax=Caerostris darwini TaxID=1538125 RepID=A0AAV4S033_9ARAC|nr:hypothetical protein CDAR_114011 [Caerostris darwini]